MNNILEKAFMDLCEDGEQQNTAAESNHYPKKCNSFGYKVMEGNNLICGGIVSRGKRTPELGFNINRPWYGPGAQIDTKKALVFLTETDARNFCNKYGIKNPYIYIGQNYDTYVRIDDNNDIPVYMQITSVRQCRNNLTTNQNNNLNSEPEEVTAAISPEIAKKNANKLAKNDLIKRKENIIEELKTVLPQYSFDIQTDIGNIHVDFIIYCHDRRSSATTYGVCLKYTFDISILKQKFNTKVSNIEIPNYGHRYNINLFDKVDKYDDILQSNLFSKSTSSQVLQILQAESGGLNFIKDEGYTNSNPVNLLFYFSEYSLDIHLYTDTTISYFDVASIQLGTWMKKYKDVDKMKEVLGEKILEVIPKIKHDLVKIPPILMKLQELALSINDDLDSQLVTVSYNNIDNF